LYGKLGAQAETFLLIFWSNRRHQQDSAKGEWLYQQAGGVACVSGQLDATKCFSMVSNDLVAGLEALSTCRALPERPSRKPCTKAPSDMMACARTPAPNFP
jgi:hypothetical protein